MGRKGGGGMTIETKFNIGDVVWLMKENKPTTRVVSFIEIIAASTTSECFIQYGLKVEGIVERVVENHLFSTKEELLKSL